MIKTFVLDTNVVLFDANCIFHFQENNIIIPMPVIEEVDKFKKEQNEIGRNARLFSRHLDSFRKLGSLKTGIRINENSGIIKVISFASEMNKNIMCFEIDKDYKDYKILAIIKSLRNSRNKDSLIFITKDTNLRIKADFIGIKAEDYNTDKIIFEELYTGYTEIAESETVINSLYKYNFKLDIDKLNNNSTKMYPNQYLLIKNECDNKQSILCKNIRNEYIVKINNINDVWKLVPRNVEQRFAIDALLDDKIKLVSLIGTAGTGKTLIAIACGLSKVTGDENLYTKLRVARPIFPMGRDIGFLPGDLKEKLDPWMQPIYDACDFLLSDYNYNKPSFNNKNEISEKDVGRYSNAAQELINMGHMEIEPLMYIRGRSIPRQYMIIDECQNLTPHEIKTIVSRASEGTKIVLTGDPNQIDNPYVDATSNGLTYIVDRFKEQKISAHITLTKCERSELAELAATLL